MISERLNELIRPVILVQKIIWFIIALSLLFYISFLYISLNGVFTAGHGIGVGMELFVYVLSGASAISAFLYYRYSISDNKLKEFKSREMDVTLLARETRSNKVDEELLEKLSTLAESEITLYALMFEYQKNLTISLILCELVTIFGSTLPFMTNHFSSILPFGIISIILCVWMFPNPGSLIRRVNNL